MTSHVVRQNEYKRREINQPTITMNSSCAANNYNGGDLLKIRLEHYNCETLEESFRYFCYRRNIEFQKAIIESGRLKLTKDLLDYAIWQLCLEPRTDHPVEYLKILQKHGGKIKLQDFKNAIWYGSVPLVKYLSNIVDIYDLSQCIEFAKTNFGFDTQNYIDFGINEDDYVFINNKPRKDFDKYKKDFRKKKEDVIQYMQDRLTEYKML